MLVDHVVGVEPNQLPGDANPMRHGRLRRGADGVLAGDDERKALPADEVLGTETQGLARAHAYLVEQGQACDRTARRFVH